MADPVEILNADAIERKIERMAYEILEHNHDAQGLMICGVRERGWQLAEMVASALQSIAPMPVHLLSIRLDKKYLTNGQVKFNPDIKLGGQVVILCDDVMYSGQTLTYASIPILQAGVKKLECLVLISRNYASFPIRANYVGLALATTLQEHVRVVLTGDNKAVYLE